MVMVSLRLMTTDDSQQEYEQYEYESKSDVGVLAFDLAWSVNEAPTTNDKKRQSK